MNKEKKVLVVEDDADTRTVLGAIIEDLGYNVVLASYGKQAIELANTIIPDLIFLDVMLPTMTGWEICEKLKEGKETKDIPVVFLTALDQTQDQVHGISLSAVSYITKPFHRQDIKKVLDKIFPKK